MNDDQLRDELQRRSNVGAVPDLVASVSPRLDAPQSAGPARVARWAPLAGLAGIAIIVLALVVAWPRTPIGNSARAPKVTAAATEMPTPPRPSEIPGPGYVPPDEAATLIGKCGRGKIVAYFRLPTGWTYKTVLPSAGLAPELDGLEHPFYVIFSGPFEPAATISYGFGGSPQPIRDALCVISQSGEMNLYSEVSRQGLNLPPGAHLGLQDVATASVAPSPTAARSTVHCEPGPQASDSGAISANLPVIEDLTGLVISCAQTDYYVPPPDGEPPVDIWVSNPFDTSGLEVSLVGRPCIDWTTLEFGRTATGYALTGHLNCDSDVSVSGGAYYLVLREPVSADNVTVTTVGDEVVPDFTASPAPSSGTNAVACPIDGLDVPVTFTDHSGLVSTCSATLDAQPGPTIPDPIVDGTTVTLVASVDTCALTAIDLDLWHPMAEDVTPYQLQVQSDIREQLTYPVGCGYRANLVITLHLTEPISASDVESFSTSTVGERAHAVQNSVQTSVGTFTLNLDAESETYATGDAINPSASLYLDGTADQVNLSVERGFGLVGPWLVEQLDGDLYIGNRGSLLMQACVTMNNHEEKIVPYDKPRWPVSGPPDDPRLKALYDDPLLHLPAGTWRISVWSSFVTDCTSAVGDGEQVAMTPSIVIQVH